MSTACVCVFGMLGQAVDADADEMGVHADLKFHSSSRMKPRWLAFALTLPTDDVLFVQYTVPTIVMSRQCDQHNKVCHLQCHEQWAHARLGVRKTQE